MKRVPLLLLLALGSCADPNGPAPSPGAPAWLSTETTFQDASVVIERVSYRSTGGLRIVGQVCRTQVPGRRPLLVVAHGGFAGLGSEWNGGLCKALAQAGNVVVESSFRGEDGSDGTVEFCRGEVDDVLAMAEIARAQPYADRDRATLIGVSHGGCIALRALQRGAPVQAAVDVFGPTEAVSLVQFWQARIAAGGPDVAQYRDWLQRLLSAAGGPPEAAPAAYAERSPAASAPALDAWPGTLLMVHGTDDVLVPVAQSCLLASRMSGVNAYYRDAVRALDGPPPGCAAHGITWRTDALPAPRWTERRYLMVYRGAGHDISTASGAAMLSDVLNFLVARGS